MKYLITGADGMIGGAIYRKLMELYPWADEGNLVHSIGRNTDIRTFSPTRGYDVIIHCAAKKDLVWCENNFNEAYDINVNGTKNIAKINHKIFIYISSDLVQDGVSPDGKTKYPLTKYGYTKWVAENWVKENIQNHTIIRSGVVFPEKIEWIDNAISEAHELKLYFDRWRWHYKLEDYVNSIIRTADNLFDGDGTINQHSSWYRGVYQLHGFFDNQVGFGMRYLESKGIKYPITPISRQSTEHGRLGVDVVNLL